MSRSRAWAELLRLPALFTVPGDALSGAVPVAASTDAVLTGTATDPACRRRRHPRHLPLQGAPAARAGSGPTVVAIAALAPIGRKSAKKVTIV
ncbi:hypothetical protein ABIE67_007782 [Streptomyces sp. V4I8]|uniref:hypothetical protein n=1 Tax=Streptomyces sp. V4I8 TaxID=3156469 RepID=UPI0035159528